MFASASERLSSREVARAQGRGKAEDERVRGRLGAQLLERAVRGRAGVPGIAASASSPGRRGCDGRMNGGRALLATFAPNETKGESWVLGWGAPEGMLAQSSCASRFGRRLLFLSMFFPDVHLAGWLLSVTVLITASAALIGVRAGGHLARPFRVIRLLVVAVVALDGERPAIRSLPDDYSIVAQHRVVSARASRRPLRVCAGACSDRGSCLSGKGWHPRDLRRLGVGARDWTCPRSRPARRRLRYRLSA